VYARAEAWRSRNDPTQRLVLGIIERSEEGVELALRLLSLTSDRTLILAVQVAVEIVDEVVEINVNEEGAGRDTDWARVERENRLAIESLDTGLALDEVRSVMPHEPAFTEAFSVDDVDYRVLFYRTQRVAGDGVTRRDETTPLIFADGRLTGWGELAWYDLTGHSLAEVD